MLACFLEVMVLLEADLENANKLNSFSSLLNTYASEIIDANNKLSSQIANLNLDTIDIINKEICNKIKAVSSNANALTDIMETMSKETQEISTELLTESSTGISTELSTIK